METVAARLPTAAWAPSGAAEPGDDGVYALLHLPECYVNIRAHRRNRERGGVLRNPMNSGIPGKSRFGWQIALESLQRRCQEKESSDALGRLVANLSGTGGRHSHRFVEPANSELAGSSLFGGWIDGSSVASWLDGIVAESGGIWAGGPGLRIPELDGWNGNGRREAGGGDWSLDWAASVDAFNGADVYGRRNHHVDLGSSGRVYRRDWGEHGGFDPGVEARSSTEPGVSTGKSQETKDPLCSGNRNWDAGFIFCKFSTLTRKATRNHSWATVDFWLNGTRSRSSIHRK